MKKTYKLDQLDCANCAAKMERAIAKIEGVTEARISFMTQRLTLDAQDDRFEQILDEARRAVRKIEPACTIV